MSTPTAPARRLIITDDAELIRECDAIDALVDAITARLAAARASRPVPGVGARGEDGANAERAA